MRTTSGVVAWTSCTPLQPVGGRPDHLELLVGVQEDLEAGPDQRLVVDDGDPDHRASACDSSGSVACTR